MKSNFWYVYAVDEDGPLRGFHDSEEAKHEGRFSGAGPADDSDLLATLDFEGDVLQDQVEAFPERKSVKL